MKTLTFSPRRLLLLLAASTAGLLLASCAVTPAYNQVWQQSLTQPAPKGGITGPWEGTWQSDDTGHTGDLRCVVTKTGPDSYDFHYWATWGPGLKGAFRIECTAESKGGAIHVEGSKKMPPFGLYHHRGTLTPGRFTAEFSSPKGDVGSFELTRPGNS